MYFDYRKEPKEFVFFIKDRDGYDAMICVLNLEKAKVLQAELSSMYNTVTHWIEKQEEKDD